MNFVIFILNNVRYAVDISAVEEVIPLPAITAIARLPSFIRGIINLRGSAIPVIDLKERLGIGKSPYELANDIIIVKTHNKKAGFIVDDTLSITDIPDNILTPPPDIINGVDIRYISATARIGSDLMICLNLDNILSLEEKEEFVKLEV
jgi:purine-binding chemotaxis protein CheW